MSRLNELVAGTAERDPLLAISAPVTPLAHKIAAGKALRGKVPRATHARWQPYEKRANPVDILRAEDEGRVRELVPIRYGRMLQSPFAFYRGAAAVMAADLAVTPVTGIRVQACGDCHLANFGGFATPERNIIFDINDFDETLPAPWEWDVMRLAASCAVAARSAGLSDSIGREMAVACAQRYRKHMAEYAEMHPLQVWYARIASEDFISRLPSKTAQRIQARVDKARAVSGSARDFPKLAGMAGGQLAIQDDPPLIFHPAAANGPELRAVIEQVFGAYRETLRADRRVLLDQYRGVDAALKVVGVGSVGRQCWILLLMSASNEPLFLQFKEAVASVLEPFAGKSEFPHHGQRVVMGQRLIQPASDMFLGWTTGVNGNHYYVRQLRDAKIGATLETFDADMLKYFVKTCGWVLAHAHAKPGNAADVAGYLGSSDQFDEAMGDFAVAYADQTERDHAALKAAVHKGEVIAYQA
jgi:uncharacterized protein (DUF2252 family)